MTKLPALLSVIILCLVIQSANGQLFITGQNAENYEVCDKWQSLNDFDKVIEFKKDGTYIPYSKGEPQIQLQYEVTTRQDGLIEIDLFFGEDDTEPGKMTIQIVDSTRIRLYVWKHTDVLDLADEYHRTEDFSSMNKYLKKIRKQE